MGKGLCDTIQFHFHTSIFAKWSNFWNPEQSWKFKYADDLISERFPLSTTIFVAFTDAWHLFQGFQFWSLAIALGFAATLKMDIKDKKGLIILIVVARTLHQIGFYIMYNHLLVSPIILQK